MRSKLNSIRLKLKREMSENYTSEIVKNMKFIDDRGYFSGILRISDPNQ